MKQSIAWITLFIIALCFATLAGLMTRQVWEPVINSLLP